MILRACAVCGTPSPESYCPKHKPAPWAGSRRRELMGLSGGAWETIRRRVLTRDQGVCYLCDQFGSDTVDHLIEVAAGGTSRTDNLASCHSDCHDRKHQEPEWARERIDSALASLTRVAPNPGSPPAKEARRGAARGGAEGSDS